MHCKTNRKLCLDHKFAYAATTIGDNKKTCFFSAIYSKLDKISETNPANYSKCDILTLCCPPACPVSLITLTAAGQVHLWKRPPNLPYDGRPNLAGSMIAALLC